MAVQKEREKVTKEELGEEILKFSEPHLLFRREKNWDLLALGGKFNWENVASLKHKNKGKNWFFKVVRIVSSGGFWGFSAGS